MIKNEQAILVTGSNGMVGYHLVLTLLSLDYKVIGLDPNPYLKKLKTIFILKM